ncbi:transposase [Nonomuraea jabiensis]
MVTDVGPVEVRVPRDVAGSFDPQQVCKRQRRAIVKTCGS